eukprot:12831130-Alexandrium_andersonii.AAC.1
MVAAARAGPGPTDRAPGAAGVRLVDLEPKATAWRGDGHRHVCRCRRFSQLTAVWRTPMWQTGRSTGRQVLSLIHI